MKKITVSSFDKMIEEHGARFLREQHRDEIERAIRNVKRTAWDKWFRREWHRAAAQRRRGHRLRPGWAGQRSSSRGRRQASHLPGSEVLAIKNRLLQTLARLQAAA